MGAGAKRDWIVAAVIISWGAGLVLAFLIDNLSRVVASKRQSQSHPCRKTDRAGDLVGCGHCISRRLEVVASAPPALS